MAEQINQDITIPEDPPSSRDRVNFRQRADAFVAWLKTFAIQMNALVPKINSALTWINANVQDALSYAQTASDQAGIATTKASAAAASAEAAHNAQIGAEAALDAFDDRYLGAKETFPTVDNDGNPLQMGAKFYKSSTPKGDYVYDSELGRWSLYSFTPTSHDALSERGSDDAHPMSSITGLNAALTDVSGNLKGQVVITTNTTLTAAMTGALILVTAAVTVTLPAINSVRSGSVFTIKNIGTGTVTIAPNNNVSDTQRWTVFPSETLTIMSDGGATYRFLNRSLDRTASLKDIPIYKGFKDDGTLLDVSGLDLNTVFYNFRGTVHGAGTHSPTNDALYYYVDVFAYQNSGYCLQIATLLDTVNPIVYVRTIQGGGIGAWKKIMADDFVTLTQSSLVPSAHYTLGHGLGAYPKQFFAYLECVTADQTYAVGDRLLAAHSTGNQDVYGIKFYFTTVGVGILLASGIGVYKKDLSSSVLITLANWKIVMYLK